MKNLYDVVQNNKKKIASEKVRTSSSLDRLTKSVLYFIDTEPGGMTKKEIESTLKAYNVEFSPPTLNIALLRVISIGLSFDGKVYKSQAKYSDVLIKDPLTGIIQKLIAYQRSQSIIAIEYEKLQKEHNKLKSGLKTLIDK